MQDTPDVVTVQWIKRHGIKIPRAAGVFQSPTGWVKVDSSGTIVAAGEKDQTILAWLVEAGRRKRGHHWRRKRGHH